jgi:vacuolar-type H+-ATPase subunit I/STV1
MPRVFYDDVIVEDLDFTYRELIREDKFDKVPINYLLDELSRLQEKKERIKVRVNEELDRITEKIKVIDNYIKNKK